MRKVHLLSSVLLLVFLLVACAPQTAPVPQTPAQAVAPAPAAALPAAPTKPAWEIEWEKTLAAAKNEGRVMLNLTAGGDVRRALMEGFQKAHGIGMEVVVAPGGRAIPAIAAERRAGLFLRDVYVGGTGAMVLDLKPMAERLDSAFILPDLTDPEIIKRTWYEGKLNWVDEDHTVLSALLFPMLPLAINTNLVREGEIKSYYDLLDPKWKGKMLLTDPSIPGTGATLLIWVDQVLGWDWFQQLVKNEPVVMQDGRLIIEWLAHGKVPIVVAPASDVVSEFRTLGAPVKSLTPKEGTWLGAGTGGGVSMLKQPAHPNATKVFVNWLLSKEGQTILAKSAGGQSAREDVATDFLDPQQVRVAGVKYFNKDREDLYLLRATHTAKAKEILAPLMKK